MSTALFYASSTGNTEDVAKKIVESLDGDVTLIDVASDGCGSIDQYDKVILGTSTWGEGDLQDDWEDIWEDFCGIDFNGKTVALFGLGDQESYSDHFANAVGTLYEQVKEAGGNVVGFTSTDEYTHEESSAQIDDQFVGLLIDEDNQDDLTDDRISAWTQSIKSDIL